MTAGEQHSAREPSLELDEPLGRLLFRLRQERDLTTSALARESGVSQGQISKIENLQITPSPDAISKITSALQLPGEVANLLVEQARHDKLEANRARSAKRLVSSAPSPKEEIRPEDWMGEEIRASRIRNFEPIVVPGLLQTSEYARRILNGFHSVEYGDDDRTWPSTAAVLRVRAARQERLYDTAVTYEFVIMEQVMRFRFGEDDWPILMANQIQRIEAAVDLPNVSIRILPEAAILSCPPVEAFTIVDDSVVLTESTLGGGRRDRERKKIDVGIRAFDQFWKLGTDDVLPILKRYKAELLGEAISSAPDLPDA
ncbi:Scr1 family TA system antitoxin-like transcriptional regulator [Pseudofrankia sp. DC12]|uniref:Scr1 family TA system antitoxin-like transcriptional regulator n=1 Tax=Pseudofrankia sp. DC12 TaxID=683315 RepID=UPI0005F84BE5|nr:Scr1 family TA system antitoxin-like transcriptional regulator [Pseudofrankia sp. DC12]